MHPGYISLFDEQSGTQCIFVPVQRHIYYRLSDHDVVDDLAKHSYFVSSQFAIVRMIGRVLSGRQQRDQLSQRPPSLT